VNHPVSDAIVFFGATGDLAYKQIFPALQGLVRDEGLDAPIIGVAKAGWSLDQLKARAKDSLSSHGGLDIKAFAKLTSLLRYVDGDYNDPSTYVRMRQELKDARRPLHYLAIPPSLFATRYVMIDDKLRILDAVKKVWGGRVTTIFLKQGHNARDPQILAGCQPADIQLDHLSDLNSYALAAFMTTSGRRNRASNKSTV
jgi:Glucose-6-phosphate dehydrogenase, NAD binding domain